MGRVHRRRRTAHHCETGRIDVTVIWLCFLRRFFRSSRTLALLVFGFLLLLALALLQLELGALLPVPRTLIMQLIILSCNLCFSDFAVAASTSTGIRQ